MKIIWQPFVVEHVPCPLCGKKLNELSSDIKKIKCSRCRAKVKNIITP